MHTIEAVIGRALLVTSLVQILLGNCTLRKLPEERALVGVIVMIIVLVV